MKPMDKVWNWWPLILPVPLEIVLSLFGVKIPDWFDYVVTIGMIAFFGIFGYYAIKAKRYKELIVTYLALIISAAILFPEFFVSIWNWITGK